MFYMLNFGNRAFTSCSVDNLPRILISLRILIRIIINTYNKALPLPGPCFSSGQPLSSDACAALIFMCRVGLQDDPVVRDCASRVVVEDLSAFPFLSVRSFRFV